MLAQTLASRAYQALNRVCLGKARRVRFKSRGRGLSSIENKRNDTGLRFVLQKPEEGNRRLADLEGRPAACPHRLEDPVVTHGLDTGSNMPAWCSARASSPAGAGGGCTGYRYCRATGAGRRALPQAETRGGHRDDRADLGPSSIAARAHVKQRPSLSVVLRGTGSRCEAIRRLQRKMDRQRRAANPDNYDAQGRIKKRGKQKLALEKQPRLPENPARKATRERKLAAHRKSLHGRKVHEIVAVGNTIILEKISYKAWQKQYGKSVGLRAPGMFVEHLRRTVASTGGTLIEVPTRSTKLSQYCHGCGKARKKAALAALAPVPLWHRAGAT